MIRSQILHPILPAWIVWVACQVPAQDSSHQVEREDDEQTDAGDGHHRAEGDRPRGVVVDRDEVDEERGPAHDGGQEEGGDDHLLDPGLPAHPVTKIFGHKMKTIWGKF